MGLWTDVAQGSVQGVLSMRVTLRQATSLAALAWRTRFRNWPQCYFKSTLTQNGLARWRGGFQCLTTLDSGSFVPLSLPLLLRSLRYLLHSFLSSSILDPSSSPSAPALPFPFCRAYPSLSYRILSFNLVFASFDLLSFPSVCFPSFLLLSLEAVASISGGPGARTA